MAQGQPPARMLRWKRPGCQAVRCQCRPGCGACRSVLRLRAAGLLLAAGVLGEPALRRRLGSVHVRAAVGAGATGLLL